MTNVPQKIQAWQMIRPWSKNKETGEVIEGKLARVELPVPELKEGEALVRIAGCGLCHTDLGYFYESVRTVNEPPLVLGHEISGTVVAGPKEAMGKDVLIPAVLPCNDCPICAMGRGNRCLAQQMPGNSMGAQGGFASHIVVPFRDLCVIEDLKGKPLSHYSVVADAATTPYQAAVRADLTEGDLAVIIGCAGGVGIYMTQTASALEAKCVIGIELGAEKLERAKKFGTNFGIDSTGKTPRDIQSEFREICKANGLPHNYGWKIFEVTGSGAGQAIALQLLSFIGKLIVVGFGLQKNEYSISRLMAFDAEMIGTWGCLPKYYPKVLELVQTGKIEIDSLLETRPMSTIQEAFEQAHSGMLERRIVLEPDF
ncbi:MAG: 6-hydroxycyclohex-1-ene-1-carbonyl-CoA dehydrogenase [Deltaproteobacteria bacterium]|nr:6-hydroxycyclohex-1-ene-1-carbonyl-CoA dehydrogenase [Deltaproteobacteria bacterium]